MEYKKWIPEVKNGKNWSTYSKGKGTVDSVPHGLFINPKVVCSDKKAKVC